MSANILIVDDVADNRLLLRWILEEEGYAVRTATDGEDCLRVLQEAVVPDLLLLDVQMPNLDGYGVLERLRRTEHLAWLPVIVISAGLGGKEAALAAGADAFLAKPILLDELLRTVVHWLGVSAARRMNGASDEPSPPSAEE
jgi:CheY-like chemotaxis protein